MKYFIPALQFPVHPCTHRIPAISSSSLHSSQPCNFQFTPALIPALQFPVHPCTHPCPAISSSPLHSSLPCNFQFTPALIAALQFPVHPCMQFPVHPCMHSSQPCNFQFTPALIQPCNFQFTPALIASLQFPVHPCTHPSPAISSSPLHSSQPCNFQLTPALLYINPCRQTICIVTYNYFISSLFCRSHPNDDLYKSREGCGGVDDNLHVVSPVSTDTKCQETNVVRLNNSKQ